jgi:hypothetical protein
MGLAARAAKDRVARLAGYPLGGLASRSRHATDERVVDVIDEAFAGFVRTNSGVARIDQGRDVTPAAPAAAVCATHLPPHSEPINRRLVADLSAQLNALDRQREQLVQLLRSIDAGSLAQ